MHNQERAKIELELCCFKLDLHNLLKIMRTIIGSIQIKFSLSGVGFGRKSYLLTRHEEGTTILSVLTLLRWHAVTSPASNLRSILLRASACCWLALSCSWRNRAFSSASSRLLLISSSRSTIQSSTWVAMVWFFSIINNERRMMNVLPFA